MANNSGRARFLSERTRTGASMNGTWQTLGSALTESPVILVIQNDTDQTVSLSIDEGTTTGISFVAGTKMVLDMRANNGMASAFTFDSNTQFYVNGAAGTGTFKIAIIYAA